MPTTSIPPHIHEAIETGSFEAALGATLDYFGCQAGTVHVLPASSPESELQLAAHRGIPPPVVTIVQKVPIGKGIAGLAAERREPITLCNLQTDTSGQARPAAKTTGMEGSIAVPMLTTEGELRGVLGIAKASAHAWSPAETGLLLAIARVMAGMQV